MTQKLHDYLVFIGRFQPFHNGHKAVIDKALELSENVIVLIGSSDGAQTIRNPLTRAQREDMINKTYPDEVGTRLHIRGIPDHTYNEQAWITNIRYQVDDIISRRPWSDYPPHVGLIGHNKDNSSYYLKSFPEWDSVNVKEVSADAKILDATDIRKVMFEEDNKVKVTNYFNDNMPEHAAYIMTQFMDSDECSNLYTEYNVMKEYKKSWESSPYPPVHVTIDAVVIMSGHVLLVKRSAYPGKGKLALPGGFLEQDETMLNGVIRELREETKISIPEPVLKGSIKEVKLFDDPHRSSRGRTITMAYHIEPEARLELPNVKGSDDAETAMWVPLHQLKNHMMFEDHMQIIRYFVE